MQEERSQQFKTTLDEVNAILAPSWDARDNIARTLISISSAAVVLTLTFSKSITNLLASDFWESLILSAWILFMLCILTSILTLWTSRNARALAPRFVKQLVKLFADIAIKPEDSTQNISELADDTIKKQLNFFMHDRWSEYFLKAALICFGTAMLLLGVVGGKQLIP